MINATTTTFRILLCFRMYVLIIFLKNEPFTANGHVRCTKHYCYKHRAVRHIWFPAWHTDSAVMKFDTIQYDTIWCDIVYLTCSEKLMCTLYSYLSPSATVVSAEPFSHGTGTLQCLQKEMATYRHWSVSLWWDPGDVPHCRILSPDKTERRLISTTLWGWRHCFVADQL